MNSNSIVVNQFKQQNKFNVINNSNSSNNKTSKKDLRVIVLKRNYRKLLLQERDRIARELMSSDEEDDGITVTIKTQPPKFTLGESVRRSLNFGFLTENKKPNLHDILKKAVEESKQKSILMTRSITSSSLLSNQKQKSISGSFNNNRKVLMKLEREIEEIKAKRQKLEEFIQEKNKSQNGINTFALNRLHALTKVKPLKKN
ncbi:hypothetical protein PVAND_015040 [Polypedilum vanderplanki]|uniref:Uncharacterized protein n=1 Tax=Polypedilum vanderplanki TaxID=319348 RepID=A0A9J6BBI1_POLVA|nr:hypothetical protein PVAND_015040 [Polypedilum vanderplanki]